MRRIASSAALVLLVLAAACSRNVEASSEPAPSSDPVGTYDFTASMGGITQTGTLVIQRNDAGTLGGYATIDGEPEPAAVNSVTQTGSRLVVGLTPPDGSEVTITMDFTGSTFTGNAAAHGQTIPLTGSKRVN